MSREVEQTLARVKIVVDDLRWTKEPMVSAETEARTRNRILDLVWDEIRTAFPYASQEAERLARDPQFLPKERHPK